MLNYKRPPLSQVSQDIAAYTMTCLRAGQPERRGSSPCTLRHFSLFQMSRSVLGTNRLFIQ